MASMCVNGMTRICEAPEQLPSQLVHAQYQILLHTAIKNFREKRKARITAGHDLSLLLVEFLVLSGIWFGGRCPSCN